MTNTERMRRAWAPACRVRRARFVFWSGAAVNVDARTLPVWAQLDSIFSRWAYRPLVGQTWGENCRPITGGKGFSLHAYGIAIDVNSLTNPYGPKLVTDMPAGMIADVEAMRTADGKPVLRWGGRYSGNKDAMHFELAVTPAELARGLTQPRPSKPKTKEVKVPPANDPPLQLVDYCDTPDHEGGLLLMADGAVHTVGQAPYLGGGNDATTGPHFKGRTAARIFTEPRPDTKLGWGYVIEATSAERYHFPSGVAAKP